MRDMVLILNFDDACTRAIARGLRAEHVYCKIVPGNIALEEVRAQQPLGVILSGGVAGGVPANAQWTGDSPEKLDTNAIEDAVDMVVEVIKNA